MTLSDRIADYRRKPNNQIPEEMEEIITRHIDGLRKTKEGKGLNKGDLAPDFPIIFEGSASTLYHLLQTGPCVLTFFRGTWCSYCKLQLQAYEEILIDIRNLGGHLVAVSLEEKNTSPDERNASILSYPVVEDDGHISRLYNLLYDIPKDLREVYEHLGIDLKARNHHGQWQLPMTATFIIDSKGLILYKYINEEFRIRMEPEQILAILGVIT